jgi:hypothetical protein
MATTENLKVVITADNKTSKGFKSAGRSLDKLKTSAKNVAKVVGGLTVAMGALGVAMFSLAKDASKALSIEESFRRMTNDIGVSADELVAKLQEVSVGTVNTADLMQSANKAMALNVAKDMDSFTQLMEIARLKGREMGLTTTQAFNDIVTGIGRGSVMILDNLGIIIKQEEAQTIYAESLGKTVDQLTTAEASQALLNAVMLEGAEAVAKAGELQETAKEKIERLTATFDNMKDSIGATILEAIEPFIADIQAFAQDKAFQAKLTEMIKMIMEFAVVAIPLAITVATALFKLFQKLFTWAENFGDAIGGVAGQIITLVGAIERLIMKLKALAREQASNIGTAFRMLPQNLGFRASGGPVSSGSPYVVGEQGPELFVPTSSGRIVPNGGGGASIVINNPVLLDDSMVDRLSEQIARVLRSDFRV